MTHYIYCDESCHLEHDESNVMVLGAMSCPEKFKKDIFEEIRRTKIKHGLDSRFEIKWTKVSFSKIDFYLELLAYFFRNASLGYRCVVATGKDRLDHDTYNDGEYDNWYYKMYFYLLNPMTPPHHDYRIFIDKKDTRGGPKVARLQQVLSCSKLDFSNEIIKDVRQVQSHESEILQLADLINGAVAYYHRGKHLESGNNAGKIMFVNALSEYNINLSKTTAPYEPKFNILIWKPRGAR